MGRKFRIRENKKNHNRCLTPKFLDKKEEKLKFTAMYCNNNTPTNELQYQFEAKLLSISKTLSQSSSDAYIM